MRLNIRALPLQVRKGGDGGSPFNPRRRHFSAGDGDRRARFPVPHVGQGRYFPGRGRQGAIFITALGIIVILSSLALVFAQSMRTEAAASANDVSYAQADAVEQGAERWALAQVEANRPDAVKITRLPAAALQVGGGYFWCLSPDPVQDQAYAFGIVDESAKLNINRANPGELQLLPGNMSQDVADAIYDWRSNGQNPTAGGAETDYYESLQEPYRCKNAAFETVEELALVKGITPQLLFGSDPNRDGVLSAFERQAGAAGLGGSTTDDRGIFNYLTCYTAEPDTSSDGTPRIDVNNPDRTRLRRMLSRRLSEPKADHVILRLRGRTFGNLGAFFTASGLSSTDFATIVDRLTTTDNKSIRGLVNVNTASSRVLQCLGLSASDADALVSKRSGASNSDIGWVFKTISGSSAAAVAGSLTARSFQYSADIVAVSGDGRAFKRVRVVIDAQQAPVKVIYRRDLSSLGWPLPSDVRTFLRAGRGVPPDAQASSVSATGA